MVQSLKRTSDMPEYIAANGNLVRVIDIAQALDNKKRLFITFYLD